MSDSRQRGMKPGGPSPMTAAPAPPTPATAHVDTPTQEALYAGRLRRSVLPEPPAFHFSPDWPIWRRLDMSGSDNPRYGRGQYTRRRRYRLEKPLNKAIHILNPGWALKRLPRLLPSIQDRLATLLGWLMGECHPRTWTLQHRLGGFYVPRAAWAFCAAWLRIARLAQRLLSLSPSLISSTMPPLLKRGERGQNQDGKRSAHDEVERLRAWCQTRGLAFEGGLDQA